MFSAIVGNHDIKTRLTHLINTGTVAHAYLIEGAAGSGKHTLVQAILQALAKDESPEVLQRLSAGLCPDVHTVAPDKDHVQIGVDQIRNLLDDLVIVPDNLSFHAVIIHPADAMNAHAQNALLKQLEEPYSNTFFFLLTENASALLPTIRSRVQLIRMERISAEQISAYLQKNEPLARTMAQKDPAALERIVRLCDGNIGTACSLLRENAKRSALYDMLLEFFQLYANRQTAELYTRICKLSKKNRESLQEIFSALLAGLRDLILVKRNAPGDLLFFRDETLPRTLVVKLTSRRLMHSSMAVQAAIRDCAGNGNITLLLTALANALCLTNI